MFIFLRVTLKKPLCALSNLNLRHFEYITKSLTRPCLFIMTRTVKVRPHRTRSAAADCGLCPLGNVTF